MRCPPSVDSVGGEHGYDAGKKVSGIKRHIAVDTQGLPHAIEDSASSVTIEPSMQRRLAEIREDLRSLHRMLASQARA